MIPCAANGSLSVTRSTDGNVSSARCFHCDATSPVRDIALDSKRCQTVCGDAVRIFSRLIKSPAFAEARQTRVLAMVALKKFTMHFDSAEFMDLINSPLGQWCVASLQSSSRELRITAGYIRLLSSYSLSNMCVAVAP